MSNLIRAVYTPEGGSRRVWVIDVANPPWDITFNTEKVTDWPWLEFSQKLSVRSVIAMRALLWTLRRRDEPKLALDSVEVLYDEFQLEDPDEDETAAPEPEADSGDPKED